MGRGLDALLPKVEKGVQNVTIALLRASPLQPRKNFDEAAIAELTASVAERGVLQPIMVRPVDGGYEVVAGERRLRAAQRAGLTTIPAVVRELSDRETLEIAIIENLQREDLNPIEEARAFKQLLDFGMNQEQVSSAVGRSRSAVANQLRLLTLSAPIQAAVESNTITAGHARAIMAQTPANQEWAFEQIVRRGLSVRQAEDLKPPSVREDGVQQAAADAAGPYRILEEGLSRHAGTKVKIAGNKRGRIELHFHNEDELTRLLELLGYQA
ncbi:MAG TPA: ParB/RepB/Spo0J family partition protein [Trueperaceae bacterium]|nr:ParB/RepB/Spo0J family partition protein [Trueperaceae bacterium]